MKIRFLTILCHLGISVVLLTGLPRLNAFGAEPTFDSSVQQYLYYDQNFNVIQRLRTDAKKKASLLSPSDKAPQPVNIYQVKASSLKNQIYTSKFISGTDLNRSSTDGTVFIPVLESDRATNLALTLRFGKPRYQTFGLKTLIPGSSQIDLAHLKPYDKH